MIKEIGNAVLSLLYPNVCPLCGNVTKHGLCKQCIPGLQYIAEPRCKRCGKPVIGESQEYCYDCSHTHHYYDRGLSLWLHQKQVQTSVYQFKYHNRRIYSRFYAAEMAKQFAAIIKTWEIALIIPIPLSRKRRKYRGYNQAELLARELGYLLGAPVDSKSLRRVRDTNPQKKLDAGQRRRNLRNAFAVQAIFKPPGNVLLIDDIYTTGNTIDNAARVLKQVGVPCVYFLTISIGQGY